MAHRYSFEQDEPLNPWQARLLFDDRRDSFPRRSPPLTWDHSDLPSDRFTSHYPPQVDSWRDEEHIFGHRDDVYHSFTEPLEDHPHSYIPDQPRSYSDIYTPIHYNDPEFSLKDDDMRYMPELDASRHRTRDYHLWNEHVDERIPIRDQFIPLEHEKGSVFRRLDQNRYHPSSSPWGPVMDRLGPESTSMERLGPNSSLDRLGPESTSLDEVSGTFRFGDNWSPPIRERRPPLLPLPSPFSPPLPPPPPPRPPPPRPPPPQSKDLFSKSRIDDHLEKPFRSRMRHSPRMSDQKGYSQRDSHSTSKYRNSPRESQDSRAYARYDPLRVSTMRSNNSYPSPGSDRNLHSIKHESNWSSHSRSSEKPSRESSLYDQIEISIADPSELTNSFHKERSNEDSVSFNEATPNKSLPNNFPLVHDGSTDIMSCSDMDICDESVSEDTNLIIVTRPDKTPSLEIISDNDVAVDSTDMQIELNLSSEPISDIDSNNVDTATSFIPSSQDMNINKCSNNEENVTHSDDVTVSRDMSQDHCPDSPESGEILSDDEETDTSQTLSNSIMEEKADTNSRDFVTSHNDYNVSSFQYRRQTGFRYDRNHYPQQYTSRRRERSFRTEFGSRRRSTRQGEGREKVRGRNRSRRSSNRESRRKVEEEFEEKELLELRRAALLTMIKPDTTSQHEDDPVITDNTTTSQQEDEPTTQQEDNPVITDNNTTPQSKVTPVITDDNTASKREDDPAITDNTATTQQKDEPAITDDNANSKQEDDPVITNDNTTSHVTVITDNINNYEESDPVITSIISNHQDSDVSSQKEDDIIIISDVSKEDDVTVTSDISRQMENDVTNTREYDPIITNDHQHDDIVTMETSTSLVKPVSRGNTPDVTSTTNEESGTQSSVKVVTNQKATWEIQSFRIVASDSEEDDDGERGRVNEGGLKIDSNDFSRIIHLYRQEAEAKSKDTTKSTVTVAEDKDELSNPLSLNILQLTDCENEIESEESKILLLSEQLQLSENRLKDLKQKRIEIQDKITKIQNEKRNQSLAPPIITFDDISDEEMISESTDSQRTSFGDIIVEDISQPSSVAHSPVSSIMEVELVSDSDVKSGNESGSWSGSEFGSRSATGSKLKPLNKSETRSPKEKRGNKVSNKLAKQVSHKDTSQIHSNPVLRGTRRKHLLNLMTARQQQLALAKRDLLTIVEHNQQKKQKSSNQKQSVNKKTRTHSSKTVIRSRKPHSYSTNPGFIEACKVLSVNIDTAEAFINEWFDHMTSGDVITGMTHTHVSISPLNIAMKKFLRNSEDDSDEQLSVSLLSQCLSKEESLTTSASSSSSSSLMSAHYESPLLLFKSYRLSPLYRTLFKRPLSSSTHSNAVNHSVIMCHHESQGKCNDKSCTAQHWSDIEMTHDDIVDDIIKYAPSSEVSTIRQGLASFRDKLSSDQLLMMAAHTVYNNVSHDDHVTLSDTWLHNDPPRRSKVSQNDSVQCGLSPVPHEQHRNLSTANIDSNVRYFAVENTSVTPTSLINKSRRLVDDVTACNILEKGLEEYPANEELWIEYMRRSVTINSNSMNILFNKALSSAPQYTVHYEVIRLSSGNYKKQYILQSLNHFIAHEDCSHIIIELLLTYSVYCLMSSGIEEALSILNLKGEGLPQELLNKFTCEDKVCLALVHLHLLHTRSFPHSVVGCHGNHIPIRMITKKPFFIPWRQQRLSQKEFDETMQVFRSYLKCITSSTNDVSFNVKNCLPLYLNLFSFEISQGNSSTTKLSIARLLEAVPNIRELSIFEYILSNDVSCEVKSHDPLMYYILARNSLNQGEQNVAIQHLQECSYSYFKIDNRTEDSILLYRKLLRQHLPYDYTSPPYTDWVDHNILQEHLIPLWLNYCLLVELRIPSSCDELTDVYECSINSVHTHSDGYGIMWFELIQLLSSRVRQSNVSLSQVKQLLDVSQRFCLAVSPLHQYDTELSKQISEYNDYTLHNEIMDLLLNHVTSSHDKIKMLEHIKTMNNNPQWIFRLVQNSLMCDNETIEHVTSVIAGYLSRHPHCVEMWLIGIQVELRLGRYREARWMFDRAVQNVPYSRHLWNQFIMFELTGIVHNFSNISLLKSVLEKCNEYNSIHYVSLINSLFEQ